ncbi:MAG: VacJ family lipoprotein [Saccharospirillum sp.]|nr:VacJ family lipoprotein [Saccharospirillum sp.]
MADSHDPFERVNRATYRVNIVLDEMVLKPVSVTYTQLTPDPVERGVRNFFNNVGEVRNITNNLLQGKWRSSLRSSGRFAINSTVGLLGVFDVARPLGLDMEREDFGQTLGVWGIGSGPYLVLPLLGPSSVRDTSGLLADFWLTPLRYTDLEWYERAGLATLDGLQTRADLIASEGLLRGDPYLVLREAYLSRREHEVQDGNVRDDAFLQDDPADDGFIDESGWDEDFWGE